MTVAAARPLTRISTWGNSEAVRIPRGTLRAAGLLSGDDVEVVVNERNNIELVPAAKAHRRVLPKRGVNFDTLFAHWEPSAQSATIPWPDDELVGAEREAWAQ